MKPVCVRSAFVSRALATCLMLLVVGVFAAACNDSITAPDRRTNNLRPAADLPPVQVIACGPGYEGTYPNCYPIWPYAPWMYEQDPCYWDWYSYGCPGYSDLGDYIDPTIDDEAPPPADPDDWWNENDLNSPPDCNARYSDPKIFAYCKGSKPSDDERAKIYAALDRMKQKGGTCAALADMGFYLLATGVIHMYNQVNYPGFGGAAPLSAGTGGWMVLSRTWTAQYPDSDHVTQISPDEPQHRDLQQVLAHELDHLKGSDHIGAQTSNPDMFNTPNSNACSDIKNFYS